jgi:hypothetical protein
MSADERLDPLPTVAESQASALESRIDRLMRIGEVRRNLIAARDARIEALIVRMVEDLIPASNSLD